MNNKEKEIQNKTNSNSPFRGLGGSSFYSGKRVLITGHTGFKGSWLSIWLHKMGAEVIGLSLDPFTVRDNFVLSGIGKKIKALLGAFIFY